MDYEYNVISHTHWDREWYLPFEIFRYRLCDLINRLLIIFEEQPEFIFHLDAQTIMLEDYFSIYPHNEKLIKEYIKQGRLIIGPWYLQNDFLLTSGESTVRNLLEGFRTMREYGGNSKIGYAPDQFGHIRQMPQILKNFGISFFLFGRGYSFYKQEADGRIVRDFKDAEFLWEGADGTRILSVVLQQWYHNAQRFPADLVKSKLLVDVNTDKFRKTNKTNQMLLMNGVDHLEAQDNLLPALDGLRKEYNVNIGQATLDEYAQKVKEAIEKNDIKLSVFDKNLTCGHDFDLLRGTWSNRSYIKAQNVLIEVMLGFVAEPLYAALEAYGFKGIFDNAVFRQLWRDLMKNHPHDSICCCSNDNVIAAMADRYRQLENMLRDLIAKGMNAATHHMEIAPSLKNNDNYIITVANTSDRIRDIALSQLFRHLCLRE